MALGLEENIFSKKVSNPLDIKEKRGNVALTVRYVPRLKGEIPDVKKVKPSLVEVRLTEVFCFYGQ